MENSQQDGLIAVTIDSLVNGRLFFLSNMGFGYSAAHILTINFKAAVSEASLVQLGLC